jgi:hypothetical protein
MENGVSIFFLPETVLRHVVWFVIELNNLRALNSCFKHISKTELYSWRS